MERAVVDAAEHPASQPSKKRLAESGEEKRVAKGGEQAISEQQRAGEGKQAKRRNRKKAKR